MTIAERIKKEDLIVDEIDVDGESLGVVIETLIGLHKEHSDKYDSLVVRTRGNYVWDDEMEGVVSLHGVRDESDDEYEQRMKYQKSSEKFRKEQMTREYLRLKRELGIED